VACSDKSAINNRHRIRRMEARYEYVEKLKEEVYNKLKEVVKDETRYEDFLQKLIVQVIELIFRACFG
jgi:vacuolar-type H+-ATPase subunit E/Vma4